MELPSLIRAAGWFRIVFGGLAMLSMCLKNAKYLDGANGLVALGFLMDISFGAFGIGAGLALHQVAERVKSRKSYGTCQLGLVACGMLAFCDCGWLVSAPVAIYALIQLTKLRGEFA
jgi:hypothetical protein